MSGLQGVTLADLARFGSSVPVAADALSSVANLLNGGVPGAYARAAQALMAPTQPMAAPTPAAAPIDYDMSDLPDWYRELHDETRAYYPEGYNALERAVFRDALRRVRQGMRGPNNVPVPALQALVNTYFPPPDLQRRAADPFGGGR